MPLKILVVDDEISLRETLTYNFERQGYLVEAVGDGEKAIEAARRYKPDMIILDVMLPGMSGFEVCQELRRDMNTPIIFLSARDDELDRVIGLEIGGDGYISKPFSMHELIARVKSQFRMIQSMREQTNPAEDVAVNEKKATFGNITIWLQRREVEKNGKLISLKPKEYDLLVFLSENIGRTFTRDEIIKKVWGWNCMDESRTIDVHIRWLREKIEENPYNPLRILTVHSVGYRFEG